MLSHPPPNRQSPASFDKVTRLPPKNSSAPPGYPDVRWSNIPVPQVNPIRHMFTCQKPQRSMPCNMVKSGLTWSRVFRRRHLGRRVTAVTCLRWPTVMYISHRQSHQRCNTANVFIVRRAGLLWSQQDFEWRWSVPLFKCLTVLEFSFILFDLCLLITFFNFIMNYVPIVTFWIFTYHKIWILSIMFCFIWSYWIIYFLACLEVSWRVVS